MAFLSKDFGIDLGSSNTLVFCKGSGIIVNEPSMVALRSLGAHKREIVAVGKQAQEMIGRAPKDITVAAPLKDGVIEDIELTEVMLRYFIKKELSGFRMPFAARAVVSIPANASDVEKRAVEDAAKRAGIREVLLIEAPLAAAIGAGLPVTKATGSIVADIGGGMSEVAVVSLGGIVAATSLRLGGNKMDEAIASYVMQKYDLIIGEQTAQTVKHRIAAIQRTDETVKMRVSGRDSKTGLPAAKEISSHDIAESLEDAVEQIIGAIKETLEKTPPELLADLVSSGLVLTGAGALLFGICARIEKALGIKAALAQSPKECVVYGTAHIVNDIGSFAYAKTKAPA